MKKNARQPIADDMLNEVSGGVAENPEGITDGEENLLKEIFDSVFERNKNKGDGKYTKNNKFNL